jgi:hypothetical protein
MYPLKKFRNFVFLYNKPIKTFFFPVDEIYLLLQYLNVIQPKYQI